MIAVTVGDRYRFLLGDPVRPEIGNLSWKLVLQDRFCCIALAFGA